MKTRQLGGNGPQVSALAAAAGERYPEAAMATVSR